jgi:Xaa-Pro aminopeptidase
MSVARAARRALLPLLVALAGSLAGPLAAQPTPAEHAARRDSLLARIDSGVVVAFGGVEPVDYWPPFAQLPSFEYLTGHGEPNAVLVLAKRASGRTAALFVPPRNARAEVVGGARLGPAEAEARLGLAGRPRGALGAALDSLLDAGLPLYVVRDVHAAENAEDDSLTAGSRFVEGLRRARPSLPVQVLDAAVLRLRARKSPAEIALLRRAAEISAAGHREAMRAAAPGCSEGELQAVLEGTFRRLGGERPGYGSIVGSGPNALTLHYTANSRVARDGELVLIDAATAYRHYSADITRTFPVSGRFTPEQRSIYQMVLDAQAAFVRQIRPGAPVRAASDSGAAVIGAGLARLGLIEAPDATYDAETPCPPPGCRQARLYVLHGYGGHGIGLEVHDPAQYYFAPGAFGAGDVLTVEPGVYINPAALDTLPDTPRNQAMRARVRAAVQRFANIGVRVEDDYVVTERGTDWLSSGVPREIADIEALMRTAAPPLPGGGRCGPPGA